MNTGAWVALSAIALIGAYRQFMDAWFLYQCRKRNLEL